MKYVFQTENDVVVLTSSGTGAMEAAVVNLVPRGGKAIVLESGVFSRRWADICQRYGIEVVRHAVAWGQAIEAADVARLLAEHPDAVAVFGTLMESSTGVGHDVQAIGEVVAASNALWVVDGISGVGAMRCLTDAWNIDVLVVGSQKALMIPPGLAIAGGERSGLATDGARRAAGVLFRPQAASRQVARQAGRRSRHALDAGRHAGGRRWPSRWQSIRAEGIEAVWARSRSAEPRGDRGHRKRWAWRSLPSGRPPG